MPIVKIPLNSRVCTNSEEVTQDFATPSFKVKNNIAYNGTLRNAFKTEGLGTVLTSGDSLEYSDYKDKDGNSIGAIATLSRDDKKEYLPFNWLLSDTSTIGQASAGSIVNSLIFEDEVYTLYDNRGSWTITKTLKDDTFILQKTYDQEISSVIFSSVYELDEVPIVITLSTIEESIGAYSNTINLYRINNLDDAFFTYEVPGFIPLGDLHSATIRMLENYITLFVGCDNLDKNRALTMLFRIDNNEWKHFKSIKWFGVVSPKGDITGEPIPNPDQFSVSYEPERRENGTYLWDTFGDEVATPVARNWELIAGYYINPFVDRQDPIIIAEVLSTQYCHVNLSENDTDTAEAGYDPKRYLVTNFAEARDIYYAYSIGWAKSYARITERSSNNVIDLYIKTFGVKPVDSTVYRTESMIFNQGGVKPKLPFDAGKLNQRIYGVGGTNKAVHSILSKIPFTVELIPAERNVGQMLDMQVYALNPLSFSFNKTLVTTGSNENIDDNRPIVIVPKDAEHVFFSYANQWYIIEKTSDFTKLKVDKVADYYFRTNILDNKNLIAEDRRGNITLKSSFCPYHMEAILDTESGDIDPPGKDIVDTNNEWRWAAGWNANVVSSTVGIQAIDSCSYIIPGIYLPLYIPASQQETFTEATLENRGSILKPIITHLFDDYEEVDLYYTLQSAGSSLSYKSSAVLADTTDGDVSLYGKDRYNIEKQAFIWSASDSIWLFPIGVGSVINGINHIQPTVEVSQNYAARLYKPYNKIYMMFNFIEQLLYGNEIFTVYNQNYYFDGQAIYFTGSNTVYSAINQFVCHALGMKFLANSGSEAFFYSEFEKKLFSFSGSNTLQPADALSSKGDIVDAIFSSNEYLLYMLTSQNEIIVRSSTDTALLDEIKPGSKLEATSRGLAITNSDGSYFLYSPHTGTSYRDFVLETEYMGKDEGLLKCSNIEFKLFNINPTEKLEFEVETSTLTGIQVTSSRVKTTVSVGDWKGSVYKHVHTLPANENIGNAFKVKITSKNLMAISYLGFNVNTASETSSVGRRNR